MGVRGTLHTLLAEACIVGVAMDDTQICLYIA